MMRIIFFKFLVFPSKSHLWLLSQVMGGTPLYLSYRHVPPQRVWVLHRFGLNSRMVFEEIWECMDVFVVFIPNE